MDEKLTESIVECTDCGRKYRAVAEDAAPPLDELECYCGSNQFTEQNGLVRAVTR